MAVAGLISLMVGLLALLFWAVTSALVFLLLIHAHRWAAFRRHQAYDYRSAPYKAALKLAAQQVATGLILILAGMVATIKFNVNPGDPRIEYFFFLPFFLSVVFLGQRQAKFTIPLSGLWSAQIFWIPIGIAAQLLVFTGYHGFNFGNKTLYPERYEKERSIYHQHLPRHYPKSFSCAQAKLPFLYLAIIFGTFTRCAYMDTKVRMHIGSKTGLNLVFCCLIFKPKAKRTRNCSLQKRVQIC